MSRLDESNRLILLISSIDIRMIVSHKHKFVYFAPVKTASTSIHKALEQFDIQIYHTSSKENWARHQMYFPHEIREYFTFVSVRNPYHRFLSMYNHFSKEDETIEEYSYGNDNRKSSIFDEVLSKMIPINAILRTETLEKDFNNLPFVKNYTHLTHENVSNKKLNRLSEYAIDYVNRKYHLDFLLFSYKKTNVKIFM